MIISHKHKFIFIKTKKTAGTSIEVFLSQYCGDNDIVTPIHPRIEPHVARNYRGFWNPVPDFFFRGGMGYKFAVLRLIGGYKFYNHIPAMHVKERIPDNIWDSYFKFCVERNPWDKTISHYYWRKHEFNQSLTFERYLQKGKFCLNYPLYIDHKGKILVDRVVKYESLASEMSEVFAMLGIPFNGDFGVKAKSGVRKDNRSYREVYTNEQKKIVEEVFSREIELHGYCW